METTDLVQRICKRTTYPKKAVSEIVNSFFEIADDYIDMEGKCVFERKDKNSSGLQSDSYVIRKENADEILFEFDSEKTKMQSEKNYPDETDFDMLFEKESEQVKPAKKAGKTDGKAGNGSFLDRLLQGDSEK